MSWRLHCLPVHLVVVVFVASAFSPSTLDHGAGHCFPHESPCYWVNFVFPIGHMPIQTGAVNDCVFLVDTQGTQQHEGLLVERLAPIPRWAFSQKHQR